MRMQFEGSLEEMQKVFEVDNLSRFIRSFPEQLEVKLGETVFTCYLIEASIHDTFNDWWGQFADKLYSVVLEGSDKKEEDIRKAKALVNKTKEDHKEAQRILSALTEEK